ncbi:ABC transporter permease subunit [Portibacter marinus]|uniref:ABC transporter permease subunit n=1 Tax=Portibacter marinus TaxID=2898660 RepID=UPI001F3EC5C7|nr:ABC transporter permease subunit [Portibacter marinus]
MIWNLYRKELQRNIKYLLIWASVLIILTFTTMAMYPYMSDAGDSIASVMKMLPPAMMKAFGIDPDMFTSIVGLYNTYYGFYLVLLMGIYSGTNGATIISKEKRDKTSEFLMTKPLTRKQIFQTKMVTLFTLLILIFSIQVLFAYVGVKIFGEANVNWEIFRTMHTHGLGLLIFFTSLGVFLSMIINGRVNFMGIIVGIVFGSYFLDAISKAVEQVNWLGYISPNYYLDFNIFAPGFGFRVFNFVFFMVLSLALIFSSYLIFRKKDL